MTDRYILDGKVPVPEPDLMKWGEWMGKENVRTVKKTQKDGISFSTIFLGLDHNFGGEGDPILFETMVFGGKHDQEQDRYSTWEEAEKGHDKMVKRITP